MTNHSVRFLSLLLPLLAAAPWTHSRPAPDSFAGAIPTILKLNSANSLSTNKDQAVTASVKE